MGSPQIVLSGIRATGQLHLGNYVGVLQRFARLSESPEHKCFFFVADLHTLTTLKEAELIQENSPAIILDYLAAGVNPDRAAIYMQSSVPQVTELAWYLSCLSPVAELLKMPTYKEKKEKQADDVNGGLLFYPILMAADILGPRADLVPVGKDQAPHLELAIQLARKFNSTYGKDLFPVPDALTGEMVLIPGLSRINNEGRFPKMGKSDDNTINLSESEVETGCKIALAPTSRGRRSEPGDPDRCVIYALHSQISPGKDISWSRNGCLSAEIGCVDCKSVLTSNVNSLLKDFRERRRELGEKQNLVKEVLAHGREQAAARINETLGVVRELMGIDARKGT